MPAKVRLPSGTVLVIYESQITCETNPELAEVLTRFRESDEPSDPDPDFTLAIFIERKLDGEMFDYEPYNMDRSRPDVCY